MPTILGSTAQEAFGFLTRELGFNCTRCTEYSIRWESKSVFVELVYDGRRSFEVDVHLGLLNSKPEIQENVFSINEIVRVSDSASVAFLWYQASSQDRLDGIIVKIAKLLRTHGMPFLQGESEAFYILARQRREESIMYQQDREKKRTLDAANYAWKDKEYQKFVELLSPLRAKLSLSDLRKYEYAQRQIAQSRKDGSST